MTTRETLQEVTDDRFAREQDIASLCDRIADLEAENRRLDKRVDDLTAENDEFKHAIRAHNRKWFRGKIKL